MLPVVFVLHFTVPLQPVAVNSALSVPQRVVLFEVIDGVFALSPVRMIKGLDDTLLPH